MIRTAGLVIQRLQEPRPTEEHVERRPEPENCFRVPYFVLFDLAKACDRAGSRSRRWRAYRIRLPLRPSFRDSLDLGEAVEVPVERVHLAELLLPHQGNGEGVG